MLTNIISNLESGDMGINLAAERSVERVLFIVITSDRGLCGAYNSTLVKLAESTIEEQYASALKSGNVAIWGIGKKGWEYFQRRGYKSPGNYRDIFLNLSFETVQQCAVAALETFVNKEFDVVELVYSEFKNAATQRYKIE